MELTITNPLLDDMSPVHRQLTIDVFDWNESYCQLTFRGHWQWGYFPETIGVKGKESLVLFKLIPETAGSNGVVHYRFICVHNGKALPGWMGAMTLRIPWYKYQPQRISAEEWLPKTWAEWNG